MTVKLKDAFKEKYQNHNCACTDTHGNYRDTKFVIIIIAIGKKNIAIINKLISSLSPNSNIHKENFITISLKFPTCPFELQSLYLLLIY